MNDPARQTDRELFEAVSSGDVRALAELAGRHARGLYDFALRGTLDEQQAASVVDTVFQRVREPQSRVPGQIDFRTWLYSLSLVEVLGLANEARTARISTDDERFYRRTTDVDADMAHWVWQAARGLRTRDYCVLDLTLRRGLTPEEVAEAASLTRSNLYASIGRARGAFEETFAAVLLFEYGREACPELDEMVENSPGDSLRPALRHQIIEHSEDCQSCRQTLDSLPLAAEVYISLADIEMPEALARRVLGDTSVALPGAPHEPEQEPEPTPPSSASPAAAAFAAGAAALEPDVPQPGTPGLWDEPEEDLPTSEVPIIAEDVFASEEDVDVAQGNDAGEDIEAEAALASEPGFTEQDEAPAQDDALEAEQAPETAEEQPESEPEPPVAAAVPSLLVAREPAPVPVTPVQRDEEDYEERPSVGERITSWTRGQPLVWTYALLGVAAVVAIYVGIAVADSLQSGGGDSGAVPLDTAPGVSAEREIDCGEMPIEMNAGDSTLISFEESALDGYRIQTLSYAPVSDFAEFQDLEATLEDPYSIRFIAKQQDTAEPRQEEFELRIKWERGEESASSICRLLVNITPPQ